jgi:hypothetical protein
MSRPRAAPRSVIFPVTGALPEVGRIEHPALTQHLPTGEIDRAIADRLTTQRIGNVLDEHAPQLRMQGRGASHDLIELVVGKGERSLIGHGTSLGTLQIAPGARRGRSWCVNSAPVAPTAPVGPGERLRQIKELVLRRDDGPDPSCPAQVRAPGAQRGRTLDLLGGRGVEPAWGYSQQGALRDTISADQFGRQACRSR